MIVVQTRTSAAPSENAIITFSSAPSAIWPCPTTIRAPGSICAELLGLGLDRLDPVVDVEHLPAAVELAQDRVADEPGRRLGDPGLDRQAVLGRRLDHAQVADPGEGEVERPRDRRGRQREDVDLVAEPLEPLLGGHPEALLLVDDDQPEVAEPDVLREQPVGPDDEVDRRRRSRPVDRRRLLALARRTATAAGRSIGNAANRWPNVWKCCAARTVVGTSTATCLPSWIALNAARSATSVLP